MRQIMVVDPGVVVEYSVASKLPALAIDDSQAIADSSPTISVQKLVHRYGDHTALDGVSFEVRHAELFGLLGPNGSGKTTIFRILSTLMVPVGGRAVILGYDAAKEPSELRRHIG